MLKSGYHHYYEWRRNRLRFLAPKLDFNNLSGKSVLELGCFDGSVGSVFYYLGADVTCVDVRQKSLNAVQVPVEKIRLDLNSDFPEGEFDLVLNMGLLYHLSDPLPCLEKTCRAGKRIVVESIVSDGSEDICSPFTETANDDAAPDGKGCRPTGKWIEKAMSANGIEWERYDLSELNASGHNYDWKDGKLTTNVSIFGARRLWIGEKR
jgi:SAM-dependent methyltransferase